MERVDRILKNPVYQKKQRRLDELEQDRIYCRHGREHCVEVARIMYIQSLEQRLSFEKDVIYGAALLHDIGRCDQYEQGTPHHEAGAELARQILSQCGYREDEVVMICEAVRSHRVNEGEDGTFHKLLYEADKLSRACYDCPAQDSCNWSDEKKNHSIEY
jgi:putative nucleotidyltransferase with HDIG domain